MRLPITKVNGYVDDEKIDLINDNYNENKI